MTDSDRVLPPQAAHIAVNAGSKKKTRYAPSAGHLAGGMALLMVGLVAAFIASMDGGPVAAIFAMIGIVGGGIWFVAGVFLFASNIDHIARKA